MKSTELKKKYMKEWREKNEKKVKDYRNKTKEHMKEWQENYRKTDVGKEVRRKYGEKTRNTVVGVLGGSCIKCGFSDSRALQIDNINGGGGKERREMVSTYTFYCKVIESVLKKENKYQLLCANCNWIKKVENKEYGQGFKLV